MTPLPGAPNPLVGTWKLVSFQFEAEGTNERLHPPDPKTAMALSCWPTPKPAKVLTPTSDGGSRVDHGGRRRASRELRCGSKSGALPSVRCGTRLSLTMALKKVGPLSHHSVNISFPCCSQERLRCARTSSPSFLRKPPAERQAAFEIFVITRLGFLVIVGLGGGEAVFRPKALLSSFSAPTLRF